MFVRARFVFTLILAGSAGLAQAEAPVAEPDLEPIHTQIVAAANVDARNQAMHCRSDDWTALTVILLTQDVFTDAGMISNPDGQAPTPAGEAYARKLTYPPRVRRQMRQSFLNHVRLYPALCWRIVKFASTYGIDEQHPDQTFMGDMLMEALLTDERDHGDCLPRVLASLPATPAVPVLLDLARSYCFSSAWRGAMCRRLAR